MKPKGRWIFFPCPGEAPVTIQFGAVGTDGVILASDLQYQESDPLRRTFQSQKIHVDAARKQAYCTCGDDVTEFIAKFYSEGCGNLYERFEKARELGLAKADKERGASAGGSLLFVERSKEKFALWRADVKLSEGHPYETPRQILSRTWIGDEPNAAVFFTERYLPNDLRCSIVDLKLLAVHSILTAARLNSAGISGAEMAMCYHTGLIERVSPEEIAELTEESIALDREIADRLSLPARPKTS